MKSVSISPDPADELLRDSLASLREDGGAEWLHELVTIFLGEARERIADVESALATGDVEKAKRAIHDLKGSSGTIGASTLAGDCFDLESCLKDGGLAEAKTMFAQVKRSFARAELVIGAFQTD